MRRSLLIVSLALFLSPCGSAVAATVRFDDQRGNLVYSAARGEPNDLRVRASADEPMPGNESVSFFVEDSVPIVTGQDCAPAGSGPSSFFARCEVDRPSTNVRLRVRLGDRDDRVRVAAAFPLETLLRGGPGDDVMIGGPGADTFGEGSARNGSDTMIGGSGPGAFYLTHDRVRYLWRRHPVRADLTGDRDDGERGERDRIGADVEGITAGRADDRLTGNDGPNRLEGGGGRDVMAGLGGSDTIFAGDPAVDGDRAGDRLYGGSGSDQLFGSDGHDLIDGGRAADVVNSRKGRDRIRVRDGAVDQVRCGDGADVAANDPFDFMIRCERSPSASDSPAAPLFLNIWEDGRGMTIADVVVGCFEQHPARACAGTVQLELGGGPVTQEAAFTSLSRHVQSVQFEPGDLLKPAQEPDVVVRVRSRSATGAPTDDAFPADMLLLGFPFP